jgi:hypothetical protein
MSCTRPLFRIARPQVLDWTTDLFGALFGVTFRLILLSWPRDRGVLFALLGLSVIFASASAYRRVSLMRSHRDIR